MHLSSLARSTGWLFIACVAVPALRPQTPASSTAEDNLPLDRFVVSATRTPQDPGATPSSVSILSLQDFEAAQITDLHTALAQQPGVAMVSTGAQGGPATIFLRGASAHQTLFVVDGVRMNDRSSSYINFLGGADLVGIGHLELLRGPQSTLYGSSAMGGVVVLETTRPSERTIGSLTATAGSFETYGGSAAIAGTTAPLGYSVSLARLTTANDRPGNDFDQWSYTGRFEYQATPDLLMGTTFRGQNGDYEEPGSRLFASPGEVDADNYLTTLYAQLRVNSELTTRLTLGLHRRLYTFSSSFGASNLSNTRKILDWQTTWQAARGLEIVAGANLERSAFTVNGVRSRDDVEAGFVSATLRPIDALTLTAGIRTDDFKSVGRATTWRAGAAWLPVAGTKLRATYGTGFSAPGSDDRYGVPEFGQLPNPNLVPEKSRGWDVGFDQELLSGKATASATYFHNRFRNLFEWEYVDLVTYQGRIANRARATTSGVEFGAVVHWTDHVQTRWSYTYLDTRDDVTGARLIRRPRHLLDADVRIQLVSAWSVGLGARVVADRTEFSGSLEDYSTVRLFTTYSLRRNLVLKLRVENALDESYEEVLGYASLPRGIFGSVEWRF